MDFKTFRAEFKATTVGDKGIVTAVVAVFNNVDFGNDRILPGAFDKTIADWQAKGDPVPVIWSHNWDNPEFYAGQVDPADLVATETGLQVKMYFDLNRPTSEQIFHLLKTRRVTQFSFGYFTDDTEMVKEGPVNVRNIKSLQLFEVGPTLLGMNPDTQLLEVASMNRNQSKAGRVLSAKNEESLKSARDLIDGVLNTVVEPDTTDGADGKSLDPNEARKKSIIGSIEALRDRVADALEDAYCDAMWCCIRGVIPAGSSGGVVVYDYYGMDWDCTTYQESFTDDGKVVTLAGDRKEVDIMEVVEPDADAFREGAESMSRTPGKDSAKRDTTSNINQERLVSLLFKTENTED